MLEKINQEYQTTIIIVTHNDAICNMAHRVMWLKDGKIVTMKKNERRVPARDLQW